MEKLQDWDNFPYKEELDAAYVNAWKKESDPGFEAMSEGELIGYTGWNYASFSEICRTFIKNQGLDAKFKSYLVERAQEEHDG